MSGTLYVIGTPIGNLEDMTLRQLRMLQEVDFIAAEDTRVTRKLLSHYDIHTPMVSYHDHSGQLVTQQLLQRIAAGETCGIVTDAGMPCISDPGEILVRCCKEQGIPVTAVPGPSAAITALAISGQETGRFTFEGFLSVTKKQRMEHLHSLQTEHRTMIFYEAPHKLLRTLTDLVACFGGERPVSICRESCEWGKHSRLKKSMGSGRKSPELESRFEWQLLHRLCPRQLRGDSVQCGCDNWQT